MWTPRRLPTAARHTLAVAALLAQFVAATGAPQFVPRGARAAAPFPCQNHSCGCATPERGWAGDCCCFTLEQKLAWAEARGIEPPPHVRPAVAARQAKPACCAQSKKPACCAADEPPAPKPPRAAGVRFVSAVFAQTCRGEGPGGLLKLDPVAPPAPVPSVKNPLPARDFDRPADVRACPTVSPPPLPPPRTA